jgi:hypothetical protein
LLLHEQGSDRAVDAAGECYEYFLHAF